jgi:putative transcriptional regulator
MAKLVNDPEIAQFCADFLASAREMKAGIKERSTQVNLPPVVIARNKSGLTQSQFAALLGVSVRTLQGWEQGRIKPSGAANTLIRIAITHPEVLQAMA